MWIDRKTERQKEGKRKCLKTERQKDKKRKRHMEIDKEVKADKETE